MKGLIFIGIINFTFFPNINADWWKNANFYQIYPRSFKSSSDGVSGSTGFGDLNGIISKLSYLNEIGINAAWLSPIFTSPMDDSGYDIRNFTEIDYRFGNMNDFEKLLKLAKELNIKIILDFVPNHTSITCLWFQKSAARVSPYLDYYVWHEGYVDPNNKSNILPPSNWISQFRKSAWSWNKQRQAFYLHQFSPEQPDLNYRNPEVHKAMKEVLEFWLKKGVDGFRIDAVPYIYEADPGKFNGKYPDEKRNDKVNDPDDYAYLIHDYTVDQPENFKLLYEWREILDNFKKEFGGDDRILMAETYSPLDVVMKYYGTSSVPGVHVPFNFLLIKDLNINSTAKDYANTINAWLSQMNEFRIPNWVLGNHDKNRVGTRMGYDRIDLMNIIIAVLPGISVTYQGEEIGMTDVWISWDQTVDPWACNSNPEIYEQISRDPARTPFQWNDDKNAGFIKGEKVWLPVAKNYTIVNVKRQRGIARSHLNIYKNLMHLRSLNAFKKGSTQVLAVGKNTLAILRSLGDEKYIALTNIGDNVEELDINKIFKGLSDTLTYVLVTEKTTQQYGSQVSSKGLVLMPKEGAVLKSGPAKHFGSLRKWYKSLNIEM